MKVFLTTDKEKIPSKFRIGETCFTSIAVIGGKIFSNHPKNMNHFYKDTKDLVSVIITLVTNISGGDTVFYDEVKIYELGNISHVLKYLHGRIIFAPFEIVFHEGSIWRGHIAVIFFILTRQIFLQLYRHRDWFFNQRIK